MVEWTLTVTGPRGNVVASEAGSAPTNTGIPVDLKGEGEYTVTLDVTYSREGEDPHTVPTRTVTFTYEKRGEPTEEPTDTPTEEPTDTPTEEPTPKPTRTHRS